MGFLVWIGIGLTILYLSMVDDPQVVKDIKKDFEEMYPEYYIHLIGAVTGFISASIYRKSDNRIVEAISFPNHNGTWSFKH